VLACSVVDRGYVRFVLDQHALLDFYIDETTVTDRHVTPLGHIMLIHVVYTGDQFYFNGPFILPITLKHDVARKSHNCCLKIPAICISLFYNIL
jgi:hypothetical protein